MINEREIEIQNQFIDYLFNAGWLMLGVVIVLVLKLHIFIQ